MAQQELDGEKNQQATLSSTSMDIDTLTSRLPTYLGPSVGIRDEDSRDFLTKLPHYTMLPLPRIRLYGYELRQTTEMWPLH